MCSAHLFFLYTLQISYIPFHTINMCSFVCDQSTENIIASEFIKKNYHLAFFGSCMISVVSQHSTVAILSNQIQLFPLFLHKSPTWVTLAMSFISLSFVCMLLILMCIFLQNKTSQLCVKKTHGYLICVDLSHFIFFVIITSVFIMIYLNFRYARQSFIFGEV